MTPIPALLLSSALASAFASPPQTPQGATGTLAREPVRAEPDWLVDSGPYRADVLRADDGRSLVLSNGLVRREIALAPNGATIALDVRNAVGSPHWRALLRALEPEAVLVVDGVDVPVGGLSGQSDRAFLRSEDARPAQEESLSPIAGLRRAEGSMVLIGYEITKPRERFAWQRVRRADAADWPPRGIAVRMDYSVPIDGAGAALTALRGLVVHVHYELYDGLPCVAKWIRVDNGTGREIELERVTSELLALVEGESKVESRAGVPYRLPEVWVETDYACGGADEDAQRFALRWLPDPRYESQVNYARTTPCLLECGPVRGPACTLAPGASFESLRTFVMPFDGADRARNGLARCRLLRTLAPWITENPLMMHVRDASPDAVRTAIDQCAAVGFELAILSFGSGFDLENEDPAYRGSLRELAAYARAKGVELGGYSLLSSRRIGDGEDVESPPGEPAAHGSCPALAGAWGQDYMRKLRAFFPDTGFSALEHDGPYPGDFDVRARPPFQKGLDDSQWVQFWIAARSYRGLRADGVFVNAPDWYLLNGTNKTAMGYRESNWSLPRDNQVLHTRQNIFDGTWTKPPSAGWMFVPLTEYQGGGAAATVEPLSDHLDHYRRMLDSNLGAGVQACYRGPRLFDGDAVRDMVAERVAWYVAHRDVLEGDIDHAASRRADGRDLDWLLHVRPEGPVQGMLVVYNPLERDVARELVIDLTYTGLSERARADGSAGDLGTIAIDARGRARIPVRVPAGDMVWVELRGALN